MVLRVLKSNQIGWKGNGRGARAQPASTCMSKAPLTDRTDLIVILKLIVFPFVS